MTTPLQRLIIGIDYGTTRTGIAFAVKRATKKLEIGDIEIVTDWPKGAETSIEDKVPSKISFAPAPHGNRQWGVDIAEGSLVLSYTKLELDPQERITELASILYALKGMETMDQESTQNRRVQIPDYPAKDTVDIIADYLSKVREHAVKQITRHENFQHANIWDLPVDIIFTVPGVWSPAAKNRTFKAIARAGFNSNTFPSLRKVYLGSEPKTAAIYTLRSLYEQGVPNAVSGDCYIVVDAGGGTVDLATFRVNKVNVDAADLATEGASSFRAKGAADLLELEQLGEMSSQCGALLIDEDFRSWLKKKLGPAYRQLDTETSADELGLHTRMSGLMSKIMSKFEVIKHRCGDDDLPEESWIELPPDLNIRDNPRKGIERGSIRLTRPELERMFKRTVEKTIDLIAGQIVQAKNLMGYRIKSILLSGGFGQSEFLLQEIRNFATLQNITVERGNESWTAVVRGAVLEGSGQGSGNMVSVRECPKHYGVAVSQPFSAYKHTEEGAYRDPFDDKKKAKDRMSWLVHKGDGLFSDSPRTASIKICRRFGVQDPRKFRTIFVGCDDDEPPDMLDKVTRNRSLIYYLDYDLSDIPTSEFESRKAGPTGAPYYSAFLNIDICVDNRIEANVSQVSASVNFKGTVLARFEEDVPANGQ